MIAPVQRISGVLVGDGRSAHATDRVAGDRCMARLPGRLEGAVNQLRDRAVNGVGMTTRDNCPADVRSFAIGMAPDRASQRQSALLVRSRSTWRRVTSHSRAFCAGHAAHRDALLCIRTVCAIAALLDNLIPRVCLETLPIAAAQRIQRRT